MGDTSLALRGLQPAVIAALPGIFGVWEGPGLSYMYTDSKGYVTTGTGNLIDPMPLAMALPWENPDGSPASPVAIAGAWRLVKNAWPKIQSTACAALTSIRLGAAGRQRLLLGTISRFWGTNLSDFPGAPAWPADGQLMLLSIDWAWGAGFPLVWDRWFNGRGTLLKQHLSDPPEFNIATGILMEAQAHEETINPGIIPRDKAEVAMCWNAYAVMQTGADRTRLWYPDTAPGPALAA